MTDVQRDDKGRFVPGHAPLVKSPGRPRQDDAERLRAALRDMLDDETMEAWIKAMRKKLAKGNGFAAEFVADRLMGKPAVNANITLDGNLREFMDAWSQLHPPEPPQEPPSE